MKKAELVVNSPSLPLPPRRRNIQALKASLTALGPGAPATAIFRSELYGTFAVRGTVVRSVATGGLLIGGHALDTASSTVNPVPDLLDLTVGTVEIADPPTGLATALAELSHGNAVVGYFEQKPYGLFTVTGFAVEASVGLMYLVGGLLLTSKGSRMPGALLIALHRFTDTNAGPNPARITRWPDADID
ncbi:hypothetical protein [Nocardia sp. NPDC050793]|uniref:hypothetical protein n=1 Tax=Nocardia sp. NPDC050793 TaxID=3155159 RepID=UPI0033EC5FBA